jgi:hypothetical protein
MMKFVVTTVLLVLAVVGAAAVQATLQYFTARSSSNAITVEWKSNSETDVAYYEIERAADDNVFRYVATLSAKGNNYAYSYSDTEAFGKSEAETQQRTYFTYRLKIVSSGKNYTYSNVSSVSHNVSSIKRTWGMIKDMFR